MTAKPLSVERLCLKTDPARLPFETTAKLPEPDGPAGQDRAMRAVAFGAGIVQPGYNIFVTGPQGSGKRISVSRALERVAASMPTPSDWVYVHNFGAAHRPQALRFPAGQGAMFKRVMGEFVDTLKNAMPRLFESDEYRKRRGAIEDDYRRTVEGALEQIRRKAETQGLTLIERDEGGFEFVPQRDGLMLSEDEYRRMPKADREQLSERTRELKAELDKAMQSLNATREKTIEKLRALDRELGEAEVRRLMQPLAHAYQGHAEASAHLEAIFQDVMAHIDALQAAARAEEDEDGERREVPFHRYQVNLLVDNQGRKGAPVLTLNLPSLSQLLGKVERCSSP